MKAAKKIFQKSNSIKLTSKSKRYLFSFRRRGFPILSSLIILAFIFLAFFGGSLAPYSSDKTSLSIKLTPPFWETGGSIAHPLGTDDLGRDILSRLMVGSRISFIVAMLTLILGGLGGTILGIISGYSGGKIDMALMRAADSTLAFPVILIAMFLAIILGPSLQNVVIALSIVIWARFARVIRGEVLSLKERDFIAAAKVAGASSSRIMFSHIFPNVLSTLTVLLTLQVGWVILVEASLSFLGAGIPAPTPAWGSMVAKGRDYITIAWWIPFFPGVAIALVCLSFNMMGDWLREALDPKLREAVRGGGL